MPSLLLVSADPQISDEISALGNESNCRVRSVYSISAAKEWLSMQSFDVLLVDCRYGGSIPIDLLNLAWTHHPLLLGAMLDVNGDYADRLLARALGAHIFSGSKWKEKLRKLLFALPVDFNIIDNSRTAILVVEDIDSPRDIICSYIESLGYSRVEGASGVEEALSILRKEPQAFFCIVTDILMPKLSGVDLLKRVREDPDPAVSGIPVIMLTAVPTPENLLRCLKAGASGFLAKPPKKIQLKKELEKAKRLILNRRSARLCKEKDAHLLEESLRKLFIRAV